MSAASTRLRLLVVPGSSEPRLVGRHGDAWKLRVTAPAERGRANDAAVRLVAESLDVDARAVRLVAGHGSRDKIVEVDGVDQVEAERRLGL